MNAPSTSSAARPVLDSGTAAFHGVRYLVTDVERAVDFYTGCLGFDLEHQHLPAFATWRWAR